MKLSLEWEDLLHIDKTVAEVGVRKAASFLHDVGDGYFVLSGADIYDNKAGWSTADVRIMQGNADSPDDPNWPRNFGSYVVMPELFEGDGMGSEAWGRTLAHELGHYWFGLQDMYFSYNTLMAVHGEYGEDALGVMRYNAGCPPSIMDDQRVSSEFDVDRNAQGSNTQSFLDDCQYTWHWEHYDANSAFPDSTLARDESAWHVLFWKYSSTISFDLDGNGVEDTAYPAAHTPSGGPHNHIGNGIEVNLHE